VHAAAESLGATPAQIGLAWLLHHAPNVLLIPGTADPVHLDANMAAGAIALDAATLAALDTVASQSDQVRSADRKRSRPGPAQPGLNLAKDES
jgi:aryl-alcohol dehydrogenase-like predicted oxidoreductase